MKLLFVRHGETDLNKEAKTSGQRMDTLLNEDGIRQAEETAKGLPSDVDLIFASPLKRAAQTAKIIGQKLNLPIKFRDEIKERDFGSLSGKTWEEMQKEAENPNLHVLDEGLRYDYCPWGGESVEDVKKRFLGFVDEIKTKYPGKKILVVTHGGLIRIMHAVFPQKELPIIANASIHEFKL